MSTATSSTTDALIRELAVEARGWFETAQRPNGDDYVRLRAGSPGWLSDLVRAAHGNGDDRLLPDDHRFAFTWDALSLIADTDADEPLEYLDAGEDVDVYTRELTAWLHSGLSRSGYLIDVLAEGEVSGNEGELLMLAQYRERQDVLELVIGALRTEAENRDS